MVQRNRAEGWKHAKLSGHENEALVEALTENDSTIQKRILECANKTNVAITNIDFGGLKETDVDAVLGGKTKSKTDMHIYLEDGTRVNVSIKKSLGGQVYLIKSDRFVEGFEKQYNKIIPADVKRAISLFWGTADDVTDIVEQVSGPNKAYELRKHRLVAQTLEIYSPYLHKLLVDWFNDNLVEIFDFCFAKGLAKNSIDWADIVWYKNELNENTVDSLFHIQTIKEEIKPTAFYGAKTGGSTIQLPFGFVQWHQGCMQFHHNYDKVKELGRSF